MAGPFEKNGGKDPFDEVRILEAKSKLTKEKTEFEKSRTTGKALKIRESENKIIQAQTKLKIQENKLASDKERRIRSLQARRKAMFKKDIRDFDVGSKKVASSVAKSFSQNKLTPAQLLAFRKAKAARLRAEQYQSKASIEASGYDNKFERMLAAEKFKLDEEERLRRFHETPKDILIRRAQLHDLKLQRDREMMKRHNIFEVHKQQPKMDLNFLGVDSTCNLARSPPMWDRNSLDNNVFQDTGRPTILDTPNRFAVTEQSRQDNILNAQKLNFGKVDTTRRPRRFIQQRPEDNF